MKSESFWRTVACLLIAPLMIGPLDAGAVDAAFAQLQPLSSSTGYLLFDQDVQRNAAELRLNRSVSFRLNPGRKLHIIPLKAGRYQWQSIHVPYYDLPYRLTLNNEKAWSFSIIAGKVNYVGRIVVDEWRATDSASVRVLNRSAMLFDEFPQEMSALLGRYPLMYAGPLRDDFLEAYQALRTASPEAEVP